MICKPEAYAAFITAVLLCAVISAQNAAVGESKDKSAIAKDIEFFKKQIEPILKRRCYQCHSHDFGKAKGGLVLDSRHRWQKGGSKGALPAAPKPKRDPWKNKAVLILV